jgi:hypothetical protein
MAAFWAEMGVAYLESNTLPCLHEIDIPVEFHTSKNILKMIKQKPIMPSFVLYIEYTFIHFGMSI